MSWKAWLSLVICVGLLILMVSGIMKGADDRIVIADGLGALIAAAVALMAGSGVPAGPGAIMLLVAVVALYLAATAHVRPWLLGVTMIAIFAAGFVSISSASRRKPGPSR
jgi:hypothetical protein